MIASVNYLSFVSACLLIPYHLCLPLLILYFLSPFVNLLPFVFASVNPLSFAFTSVNPFSFVFIYFIVIQPIKNGTQQVFCVDHPCLAFWVLQLDYYSLDTK